MNILDLTKEELLAIDNFSPQKSFNAVTIIPTGKLHYSGYQTMKLILSDGRDIVGSVSGFSDAIHLNGIGGYGLNYEDALNTGKVDRISWTIDCLPKSGCVRVFSGKELRLPDFYGSSFELFEEDK